MTTTTPATGTNRVRTDSWRKLALAGGVLYLMTFIFWIPAVLIGPVLTDPAYILSAGADTQVLLGTLFDFITALACIGTAVALYPVIRRQSGAASIGFVATRIFEGAVVTRIGVVCLMAVVSLRQAGAAAGTDASALVAVGQGLVAVRDQTFLLGPGVMPGLNALLLGYVLYRSRLVPQAIPAMGLIGAPLFLVLAAASILGFNEQTSVASGIAVIPIFFWELTLGLWLTFKGFRPSAVAALAVDSREPSLAAPTASSAIAAATTAGAA